MEVDHEEIEQEYHQQKCTEYQFNTSNFMVKKGYDNDFYGFIG